MSSDTNIEGGPSTTNGSSQCKTVITKIKSKKRAIYVALAANLGIASIKFFCFLITKSSAMLSESIHSLVDSFNSVCLLIGIKRASRPADVMHPFGYGLEANIWALFAALLMFSGAIVAFHSGYEKITNNSALDTKVLLDNYSFVAATLVMSAFFEFWAMVNAARAVLSEIQVDAKGALNQYITSIKYLGEIKTPTTKFVWFEDTAAFVGVIAALIALTVSKFVLSPEYAYIPDGVASWIIGGILFALSLGLLNNNMNFLTGKSAAPKVEQIIKDVADNIHGISCVHELKTMDMGTSGLIVNMNIEVDPDTPVKEADDIADMLEDNIRQRLDNISHVNIEIQADDAEENWEEKFEKLIEEGKEIDAIDSKEGQILSNFSDFANTVVKEVMVPRRDISGIEAKESLDRLCDLIIDSGHTRIPVYEDKIDNIIGIVNAKDVLKATRTPDAEWFSIKDLVRETIYVPENKFISDLLSDLSNAKTQIAIVVDEHGGVSGIVTVEDILEELVGEIYDEFDEEEIPEYSIIDEYNVELAAKMNIYDINEQFGLDIPTDDFQTIGGYVFGLLGREPEVNDIAEDRDLIFKVLEVDGIKIERLNMQKATPLLSNNQDEQQANSNEDEA